MTRLCNFFIDQGWAIGFAEVRRFCYSNAVKVNGEIVTQWDKTLNKGDFVELGKRRKAIV